MADVGFVSKALPGCRPFLSSSAMSAAPRCALSTGHQISRRALLGAGASLAAALWIRPGTKLFDAIADESIADAFSVPPLPYSYSALEPAIDAATMRLHHDKHFAAYTEKLNKAVSALGDPSLKTDEALAKKLGNLKSIGDEKLRTTLRNNGGGYLNHKQFFASLKAKSKGSPSGNIAKAIESQYGSFDKFVETFSDSAKSLFGSGFVWLVKRKSGQLDIRKFANQDHPSMSADGSVALLGCDCWEHAYYLKYNNKRADYVAAWWSVVNWDEVNRRFDTGTL